MVIYTEVKEAYYLTVAGSLSLSLSHSSCFRKKYCSYTSSTKPRLDYSVLSPS